MIDIIVFDLYGTLVNGSKDSPPRKGFYEFLQRYQDKKIVLCTDGAPSVATEELTRLGVLNNFHKLYTNTDLIQIQGTKHKRKPLAKIAEDFGTTPDKVLFLSDSDVDDALESGVNYVHLPYYYVPEEKFSFDVIGDIEDIRYLDLSNFNV